MLDHTPNFTIIDKWLDRGTDFVRKPDSQLTNVLNSNSSIRNIGIDHSKHNGRD